MVLFICVEKFYSDKIQLVTRNRPEEYVQPGQNKPLKLHGRFSLDSLTTPETALYVSYISPIIDTEWFY